MVIGIAMPLLFGWLYMHEMGMSEMLSASMFSHMHALLSKVCLISIFPDMAMLFLFYELNMWRLAKGIVVGIFPFLIASIAFTF